MPNTRSEFKWYTKRCTYCGNLYASSKLDDEGYCGDCAARETLTPPA